MISLLSNIDLELEIKNFKELFDQRVKHELRYLGDFTANYIMKHQELLLDGKKDWKEIAEIILTEMYKSVHREPPEWINYFVKENQMADSKEDISLLFRSFLSAKINDIYNKFQRSIEKDIGISNLPFSARLNFCLDNKLIPFLNSMNTSNYNNNNKETILLITSDVLHELIKNIPQISSLNEVAAIIEGFEYGQKRINGRNIRTVYGTKKQLLDFLWME